MKRGLAALTLAASATFASVLPAAPAMAEPAPAPVIPFHTGIGEFLLGETIALGVYVGTEDLPATGRVILKEGAVWEATAQLTDGYATLTWQDTESPQGQCLTGPCGQSWMFNLEIAYDGINGAGDANYAPGAGFITVPVLPTIPSQQALMRSYFDLLDRNPELSGHEYWSNQLERYGVPVPVMQYAMLFSDEYAYNRIADEYWRFFDRDPDEEGGDYYAGKVQQGMPLEYLSVDLVDSEEFYANAGGTDEDFVAAAYERILYREADQGGLDYYVGELAEGAGLDDVAYSLLRSDEALGDEVAWLYSKHLRRDVDDAGLSYWVDQVRRGFPLRRLVYELITSNEYVTRAYAQQ